MKSESCEISTLTCETALLKLNSSLSLENEKMNCHTDNIIIWGLQENNIPIKITQEDTS